MNRSAARTTQGPHRLPRRRAQSLTGTEIFVGFDAPTHEMSEAHLNALITAELASAIARNAPPPRPCPPPLPRKASAGAPPAATRGRTAPVAPVTTPRPSPPLPPSPWAHAASRSAPTVVTRLPRISPPTPTRRGMSVVLVLRYVMIALSGVLLGALTCIGARHAPPLIRRR